MKFKVLITCFISILFYSCISQNTKNEKLESSPSINEKDTLKVNLSDNFNSVSSILLYKFNSNNKCDQSKAVSIIKDNKISKCLDYIKTFDFSRSKNILDLLQNKNTYGNEDVACFDTDYSLVIVNGKTITGYINISFNCNKLISNPIIKERLSQSNNGLRKVGFSNLGKTKLLELLE